ncbi:hypothetical protein HORIV_02310 [Vreelandella olivaria]|uniref:NusG-like N-terminal domain-containing protein n=1 Tax=Vreelandella olivaria TaxID=390919 RepID=A0ABM7GBH3_9GAMM|nr:hypothetical protein HORIV_02310 [Halomonas olivaria]
MSKRWYVVHAYSGFEKHVMRSLIERVKMYGMEDRFGEILVPTEEVVEMRDGKRRKSERKFYPGYVLVEMEMADETWHLVNETPRVMGFIGGTKEKPAPITAREADAILMRVKTALISRGLKRCLSRVSQCVLLMGRLPISTVLLKK